MTASSADFIVSILEIIWINILLSGDNAVVIALACAGLPEKLRLRGIALGSAAAIGLRVLFTLVFVRLLAFPFIKLVGGVLLLWIAVKLARDEHGKKPIPAQTSIWAAVRVIIIADAVMSLDNVLAIAAASKGSAVLVLFGLGLSIPLIIFGATLVLALLERFPILIWAGAAMLGFIGGGMIADEFAHATPPFPQLVVAHWNYFTLASSGVAALLVLLVALVLPAKGDA